MLILNQKCHMAVREGLSCLAFAQHAPHRGFANRLALSQGVVRVSPQSGSHPLREV